MVVPSMLNNNIVSTCVLKQTRKASIIAKYIYPKCSRVSSTLVNEILQASRRRVRRLNAGASPATVCGANVDVLLTTVPAFTAQYHWYK